MNNSQDSQNNQLREIDLLDFIRVVKKRKKAIFSLFLAGLTAGIIWYFLAPPIYQGKIILKIGEFASVKEVTEGLKKGVYGDYPKLEAVNPSNTTFIEINVATKDYDETSAFLEKIKTNILSDYDQKVENKKQAIDKEKIFLEEEIEYLKKDISYFAFRGEQTSLLRLEIYRMEKLVQDLEKEKNAIPVSKVVKGPDIMEKKPSYLSVFFAAALGFFIGLISVSFIHWLEKNKKRI